MALLIPAAGGRRRAHRAWCPSARSGTPCPARTSAAAGRGTSRSPACRWRCGRGSSCTAPPTALAAEASLHPAHALMHMHLQAPAATAPAVVVLVHSRTMQRLTSATLRLLRLLRQHQATFINDRYYPQPCRKREMRAGRSEGGPCLNSLHSESRQGAHMGRSWYCSSSMSIWSNMFSR